MKDHDRQDRGRPADVRVWLLGGARLAADGAEVDDAVRAIGAVADTVGVHAVDVEVAAVVGGVLASVWEAGWQPVEVARAVRRSRSPRHEDLLLTAVADDHGWNPRGTAPPAPWTAQLEGLGVDRWWDPAPGWLGLWARRARMSWAAGVAVTIETLGVLAGLPAIEVIAPRPSEWGRPDLLASAHGPDDPVLAKVRALLAKAESTSFEAEAEALTAKAQELMARHAIDDVLARESGVAPAEVPAVRRVPVDDPYASAKSSLLHVVASANGVRTVWYPDLALMAVVGFDGDLDAVEVLFTSLLVQATRAMLAQGRVVDHRGHSRTRSYRQSFLLAFAVRIGERLAAAGLAARRQAEDELGVSLLPVLAGRDDDVARAVRERFPRLRRSARPSVTNAAGWSAGRTAAELASLGPDRRQLGGRETVA